MPFEGNVRAPTAKIGLVAARVATLNARDESALDGRAVDNFPDSWDPSQQQSRFSKRAAQGEIPLQVTPPSCDKLQIIPNVEHEASKSPQSTSYPRSILNDGEAIRRRRSSDADRALPAQADRHIETGAASYGGAHFERIISGSLVPIGFTSRQQAEPLSPWARLFPRSISIFKGPCDSCAAKNRWVDEDHDPSNEPRMKEQQVIGECGRSDALRSEQITSAPIMARSGTLASPDDQVSGQREHVAHSPTASDMATLISTVDEVISSHGDELRRIIEVMDPQSSFDDEDLLRHGFTSGLTYIEGLHSSGWMELIGEIEDAIRDWRGMFTSPSISKKVRFLSLDEEEQLARAKSAEHGPVWRPRRAPTGFAAAGRELDDTCSDEESDADSELE